MQIFVKTKGLRGLDRNQKTTILGKILAEEIHETSDKILAGDDHDAPARPLSGPGQDSCQRHPRGRSQAHICQDSAVVPMQLPAHQLGEHLRGDVRPLGQLSKHLRGGMQIFVKTLPPHQLSSLPAYMALRASMRVEARQTGGG